LKIKPVEAKAAGREAWPVCYNDIVRIIIGRHNQLHSPLAARFCPAS